MALQDLKRELESGMKIDGYEEKVFSNCVAFFYNTFLVFCFRFGLTPVVIP